ncbi:MAG: helix-turn-helix domain-containing protein [Microcystis sp. LE18-22.4A]|uniref:helix-turn-helix domain-containing protein n=1 Tax=Microcystis sp. LE18-22.4A TaxID=3016432 RepID=UPI0022C8D09E|nr:helix-turn-helix domain-containing protein [Microcystis sp. LE18-22.4A]MCZ8119157.1 helix-turn-helix domain-containing protein [Microcystis sp. LE18-22.4A]
MGKADRYRFYPTPEQESLLRRTLGGVRLVDNKALHVRTQRNHSEGVLVELPHFPIFPVLVATR